ncbi:MAG: TonB family protein [Kofleriaceae bacterium]
MSESTMWATFGAAVLVHVTVLATVQATGISLVGESFSVKPEHFEGELAAAEPQLKTSCSGDVLLATSARVVLCMTPFNSDDIGRCVEDAQMSTLMDLSSCVEDNSPAAAVALAEPSQVDRLKPIDPEPLLEAMKLQEQPPPPPQLQPPAPAQPPPPPPPPAPSKPAQVVETAKPAHEQEPEHAQFLSEYNTSVDKQTVARGAVNEPMVAKSKPADLSPKENPKEASVKPDMTDRQPGKNLNAPDAPGALAMRAPGIPKPAQVVQEEKTRGSMTGQQGPLSADGFVPRRGTSAIEQLRQDPGELTRGQGGAGGGVPQVPNLKPSQEVLDRALGGGNVDHLENVETGNETAMNSKQWIHANFFNRLKRQVAQNWDPASVWRRSDPNGTVYGFKTRVTEVRVSLSPKGQLAKIVVTSPSGVHDLDEEAVRSFHAAAPFPNPPQQLVSKDNLITFAFSFYFEIGQPRTSWRYIRQ